MKNNEHNNGATNMTSTTIREQIENGTFIAVDLIYRVVCAVVVISFVCWILG